jgi:hypothetical protein
MISFPGNSDDPNKKALTSIHDSYTLSNTTPEEAGEYDRFLINQFLNTLAEIALNVAARRIEDEQTGHQDFNP